jgi:hypothetical protein
LLWSRYPDGANIGHGERHVSMDTISLQMVPSVTRTAQILTPMLGTRDG